MTDVDEPGQGTYELLRDRLLGHAAEIRRRADLLNAARLDAFGQSRFEVSGSERIRTENNCVSRDIVAIGDQLLFGYNVFLGLRSETTVDDVFSLHTVAGGDGWSIAPVDEQADWLHDDRFITDLRELYTYYKDARLLQLRRTEGRLLAVFQTSDVLTDLRVFRWEVAAGGGVSYIDNRGERDHVFPPQFDFEWQTVSRDSYVEGRRSYVSVLDRVFLDPLGGTLDIRLEDNTEDGQLVISEPVDEPDQTLYDCEIGYAELGDLILLRAVPYREPTPRFYVVNTLARTARREDAVGMSAQQLPEDHGVIHPGGIELRTGEFRSFDLPTADMEFKSVIRSPNGEDVLYVFHERASGRSTLLAYNLIRREIATPIQCHGYGLFDDGTMVIFREQDEPTRVHPIQIWTTPFVTDEFHARQPVGDTMLHRIGNAELVRGVSAALAIAKMVEETEPSAAIFEDLARAATTTIDAHYWLPETEAENLAESLGEVRSTAELIIDEFEKVVELRATADQVLADAEATAGDLIDQIRTNPPADTQAFVEILGRLRRAQGELIEHRTIRYVDVDRIVELEATVVEAFDDMSARAVEFLAGEEAFVGFRSSIDELVAEGNGAATVVELQPIADRIEATNADLEVLTDVIGGLQVDDTTVRTHILEQVSETLGQLNRARAILDARRTELQRGESTAAFSVEFALLSQTIASEIARVQKPADCDAALGTLMVQLENLEGTFGAFDEYLDQIATKREDVYESFATRKQQLLDERQRSAGRLVDAADRILQSIRRRLDGFEEQAEINAYFASDPMVSKVRSIVDDLRAIDDRSAPTSSPAGSTPPVMKPRDRSGTAPTSSRTAARSSGSAGIGSASTPSPSSSRPRSPTATCSSCSPAPTSARRSSTTTSPSLSPTGIRSSRARPQAWPGPCISPPPCGPKTRPRSPRPPAPALCSPTSNRPPRPASTRGTTGVSTMPTPHSSLRSSPIGSSRSGCCASAPHRARSACCGGRRSMPRPGADSRSGAKAWVPFGPPTRTPRPSAKRSMTSRPRSPGSSPTPTSPSRSIPVEPPSTCSKSSRATRWPSS